MVTQTNNYKELAIVFLIVLFCLTNNIKSLCQIWTGNTSTDWNTASNWSTGNVPTSATAVVIPVVTNNYPIISTGINALANSVKINNVASLTMNGTGNLTISNAGTFLNNGMFNASGSTGAVIFAGNGTVSGSVTFNNTIVNGAVDFGSTGTSSITGNLTFNTGGSAVGFSTHLITYTASSTLIYNTSTTVGNEWYQGGSGTTAPGAGIPQNIIIKSGTVIIPDAGGTNRALAGNLIINPGTTLQISAGTRDLFIAGNWTNSGTFTPNGRRVTFGAANGMQTISGNTTFFDLSLDNAGASTDFSASVITMYDELRASHGTMDGGTSTFIFNSNFCTLEGSSAKRFYNLQINPGASLSDLTSTAGDTHITNSFINDGIFKQHNSHTTYFDKSGATENISGSGTTTFGNIVIGKSGTGSGTILNANAHNFSVSGTAFTFNHSNCVFNGGTGTVTCNGVSCLIGNSSGSVTGTIASFYSVKILNTTSLGIDATVTGPLIINAGNALAINGNILSLNGTITGLGTLTGSSTSNIIIGSSGNAGTLYFDQTTNNTTNVLKNLTVNYGAAATVGNLLNITAGTATTLHGIVTVNGGLYANGMLTLKSNQYGDAVIGYSTGDILNDVTVERYIPAKRAWRFLSIPFQANTGSQTINAAWQEGQTNTQLPCSFNQVGPAGAGFGTQITYNNLSGTGYDINATINPSIKVWSNNAWTTPATTNSTLITGYPAYCLFVRGDRNICLDQGIYAMPNNTTLRATGRLNQTGSSFSRMYSSALAGDFIFVGNPYASPIDISNVIDGSRTSGYNTNQFWVWDPHVAGTYGVGGFVTFSGGIQVPNGSGNYDNTYTGGTTVQSGQAFFLQLSNTSTSAILQFNETDKTLSQTNVFNRKIHKPIQAVYTNLLMPSGDSLVLVDGVGAAFGKAYSAAVDAVDAQKMENFEENIVLECNNEKLAIEFRPVPVFSDTLFYKLYLKQQPYILQIFSNNLPENISYKAWLVDKYLNTKTVLNLSETTLYSFTPVNGADGKPDTNSYRNRFMLVIKHELKATPVRIRKALEINKIAGSEDESSSTADRKTNIQIYPNPVKKGNTITLAFNNVIKGTYEIIISNITGEQLSAETIVHNGGSCNYILQTGNKWAAGTYLVTIAGKSGNSFITKLMINK